MKLFHYLGLGAAVLLILSAFLPWVYIDSIGETFTGMNTGSSNYGQPAILNIVLAVVFIIFSLIPRIWSKRVNIFTGACLVAWTIRNYLLLTHCEMGDCPDKKAGLYLTILATLLILVAALMPYLPQRNVKSKM